MATDSSILIATPTYDGLLTIECVSSVLRLMESMKKTEPNVTFRWRQVAGTLVDYARNFLASYFLEHSNYTHLLFVDADMGFSPALIVKMLHLDRPVVGCMYPLKHLDLQKVHAAARSYPEPRVATANALNFAGSTAMMTESEGSVDGNQPISAVKVEHGFVRVSYAGTGLMLIKREVFERLKERFPELWCSIAVQAQTYLGLSEGVLQCFSSFQDSKGMFMGEDIAFCRRWVDGCGGEIWACITEEVTHVGRFAYTGCFADRFKQHQIS
jgi:hypothetical protein